TLAVRIPIAAERKIMPAGDAYNFQHIASYIQFGKYPSKEKRLPAYPIFILIGRSIGFDPILTSIGISIIASTGTIVALYVLGRVFNFNRAALVGFLGLAIFDPLLINNAVRPLADGLFVFFVALTYLLVAFFLQNPTQATSRLRILTSIIITFLMFTRYEGFLIAALTAPFLFIKLPWKQVAIMAALPIIAVMLWIPAYKSIHGSITGLSYVTDATNPNGGFGELALLPDNFGRLMNGAGWKRVWSYPIEIFEQGVSLQTIGMLLTTPNWWVGVLSVIGLVYIVVAFGFSGFTILLSALGYALLLSWWWVYSRYVAPLSILFYFGAAGGFSVLLLAIQAILQRVNPKTTFIASIVPLFIIPIMKTEIPLLDNAALSRSWESNRKGYALYDAMVTTAKEDGLVLYATKEHANATLYFGTLDEKKSAKNPAKGIYLSDWPTINANELYSELTEYKPQFFIETDYDTRIPALVELLKSRGNVKNTRTFKEARWDTYDIEITNVYELAWP
ncbi:MAG: hypothetical protein AAB649_03550, partial [Patescibacteria group bacterium]